MAIQSSTLISTSDYRAFLELPENAGRIFELIEGEVVEKMPSFTPSRIAFRLGRLVGNFVDDGDLGYVTGADGGYEMSDHDILIPDVGYVAKSRLTQEPEREAPVPPDLAIEVKSPTDRTRVLRRKAERYLALGTRLVWLVFPDERVIEVYAAASDDLFVLTEAETLDGADVLPGFKLAVSEIFK